MTQQVTWLAERPRKHRDIGIPECPGRLRTMYVRVRTQAGRPTWERRGVLCDVCGEFWRD
jgi:hypothetical protein